MTKVIFQLLIFLIVISACTEKQEGEGVPEVMIDSTVKAFTGDIQTKMAELYKASATAYWNASISGKEEDFNKSVEAENNFNSYLADKVIFARLKTIHDGNTLKDELQKREVKMLYNTFMGYQIDVEKLKAITQLQTEISKQFQSYRAKVGKKMLTDNEVEEVLKKSADNKELKGVWLAHKDIGPLVAGNVIKLVKMRNEVAKELGFNNYHEMSLKLSDQNPEDISKLFDELDLLTADAFKGLKAEIDAAMSKKYSVKIEELMPWHFQNRYFQEAPSIYEIDLDDYYKGKDIVKLTKDYFAGLDMPIDDMLAKSDLFEKEGKNQHAFCTDIDRVSKDIRILCNVKDNYNWMNTMLHEYGHGVYFKYQDAELPWILNQPAHIFTTEAIAMLFGRMASNPMWMQENLGISKEEIDKIATTAGKILKLEQLVFSRWSQVMYRFEKAMYEDPDRDLNTLWWDLAEKYQLLKRPEGRDMPDWATKIHMATVPAYYHNYHLGELLASQLYSYMGREILKKDNGSDYSFTGSKDAGKYLKEKVFEPGARYSWNDMIEKATGEKLTAKYYAEQFVK